MSRRRLLILGAGGQVGSALRRVAGPSSDVTSHDRLQTDLCDTGSLERAIDSVRPQWILNAAAFTAVDAAESHPDAAHAVNAEAAGNLGRLCCRHGIGLLHLSTDYVFGGPRDTPWTEDDAPAPVNVYGRTKAQGERLVIRECPGALVVRSSWLFSPTHPCFVRTIVQRLNGSALLRIVNDQHGRPTAADDLAEALLHLVDLGASGIIHFANAGEATWYDLACSIAEELGRRTPIEAIASAESGRAAARPPYSVLSTTRYEALTGRSPRHWREALRDTLLEIGLPIAEVRRRSAVRSGPDARSS